MENQNFSQICEIISKLNNKEEVKTFLDELLTKSELDYIQQRWRILKMLNQKKSQRSISKVLSVSLCKITRGSKILKDEKSIIRQILLERIK